MLAAEAYALLRAAGVKPAELKTRLTGLEVAEHPVQHAIDDRGLPSLLVPLAIGESDVSDSESRGIVLSTDLLPNGHGETWRYLIIRCLESQLERQFCLLTDDLVRALGTSERLPGETSLTVLSKWRALFEPNHSNLLGPSDQVGLLAELHLVERLAQRSPAGAVDAWTGPERARHDFVTQANSVEVKGTTARDTFTVGIHGAKQLDDPAQGELWIYAEQMERTSHGDSIPLVVERILRCINEPSNFLLKLRASGYHLDEAPAYEEWNFSVVRTKLCRVDAEFPRLSRAALTDPALMDRIVRLDYSIDLGPLSGAVPDGVATEKAVSLLS